MNERTTQSDYAERLERVFRWLADHLDDTLDLIRLADVACLSPYHFHRVYRAMQGETAADTVRRLREVARQRGLSVNGLLDEAAALALLEYEFMHRAGEAQAPARD